MIRYLSEHEKALSEPLYREAFPEDKDAFVKYYYTYVIKNNKILVLEQEGEISSMLHLNPYQLSVNGKLTDAYYYVAVATKADCRHQGMMRRLLYRSLKDIRQEGHPFTYLMPANRAIYEPFDFRIVYQQKKVGLPLEPEMANQKMAEMFDVYTLRDEWYVEKLLEEERVCAGDPPFDIVPYIMTRITHVENMLKLLSSEGPMKILLDVQDEIIPENHGQFIWEISNRESICVRAWEKNFPTDVVGKENKIDYASAEEIINSDDLKILQMGESEEDVENGYRRISVSIAELTEFVFGKRVIKGLEAVKVLSRICINEAV